MDYLAIGETFFKLHSAWMHDLSGLLSYYTSFGKAMLSTGEEIAEKLLRDEKPAGPANDGDDLMNRVNDLAWSSQQYHQVMSRWLTEYAARAPELDEDVRQRALFWMRQVTDMLAPANYFWTNPKAVRRCIKSEGESLMKGFSNWLADLQHNENLPQLADKAAFSVGKNLAVTPGQVVYRNLLVEVIQYAPRTASTWKVPIVLIQPWINKYYIFDLTPQNSFVNYLVQQGFTVFITSWKNPTPAMGHITFEDYMLHGALQTVTVAREICKSEQVHAAGYCIGGTLLAALMGWLAHKSEKQPIADATFFATLIDFAEPGDLKNFVNPASLKAVEQLVATEGILKGNYMAAAFRLLNSADLIWRNVVSSYFNGEAPPRSDMLFWNSDSTNLPGAMCTFYLKSFYMENRMVRANALSLANRPINLKRVRLPMYVVGAQKDHICPWQATFQTCRLTVAPVRYVLANEGHITGIVNPPSQWSKKIFWAGSATRRRDATKWLQTRTPQNGSWWPDWVDWLKPRSGSQTSPPPAESKTYPPISPAPGTYVHE